MQIQILPSYKIDKIKWDSCIMQSSNPLIYATTAYLDYMADNWDGFVAEDYNVVMPVPWRKKYGIKYCYSVPFIQQLGIFGKNFKQEQVDFFINSLKKNYKYGDYPFNYSNQLEKSEQHNNYILMLSSNYKTLKEFYTPHLEKNLHKAKNFSLQYEKGEVDTTIEMFKQLYADRIKHVTSTDYKNFSQLCKLKLHENKAIVKTISRNGELLASILLLKDERRYYNLMPCILPEGRKISAGHFLFDSIIKELAQTGFIFDFEGSNIPGVAFFYKSFGAVNQPYCSVHLNSLPFPLRIFKH